MSRPIYLDYNATTPVEHAVLTAMLPFLEREFGNPSSRHACGADAEAAVEHARGQVAGLLGCPPASIVFTASGGEADSLAIKGVALARLRDRAHGSPGASGVHIIAGAIEHSAVLRAST
jgi:cysteine desulfurase